MNTKHDETQWQSFAISHADEPLVESIQRVNKNFKFQHTAENFSPNIADDESVIGKERKELTRGNFDSPIESTHLRCEYMISYPALILPIIRWKSHHLESFINSNSNTLEKDLTFLVEFHSSSESWLIHLNVEWVESKKVAMDEDESWDKGEGLRFFWHFLSFLHRLVLVNWWTIDWQGNPIYISRSWRKQCWVK